jgi:hypothetical protein
MAYRQAVVHALAGRPDAGLAALRRALDRGYSAAFARQDDDLDAVRRLPAYENAVAAR